MVKRNSARQRILESALRLLNEMGAGAVTTNHIIDDLGISPGTLYYHFRNKEEIIRALFQQVTERFNAVHDVDFVTLDSFVAGLEESFRIYFEYRFFFMNLVMLLERDGELAREYRENFRAKRQQQRFFIDAVVQSGIMKADLARSLEDDATAETFSRTIWMVHDFWLSFLASTEEEVTSADIYGGVRHVLLMLKPWMKPAVQKAIDERI